LFMIFYILLYVDIQYSPICLYPTVQCFLHWLKQMIHTQTLLTVTVQMC